MEMHPKEIEREQADRLYELLMIKKYNTDQKNVMLSLAINRAKATMSKESIAWVEKHVDGLEDGI